MKKQHISLFMPDSSSNSLDDDDLQDVQNSEDDCSIQDSGPLATTWGGGSDESNDMLTTNTSKTEDDEDINNSSGEEDNEDDIGAPGPKMYKRKKIGTKLTIKSCFFPVKPFVQGGVLEAIVQLKCTKIISDPVSIDFRSKSVMWTIYPHELDATKDYELVLGISAKSLRIVDIEEVVLTVNGVEERLEQEFPNDEVLGNEILRWKLGIPKNVQNNNRMEMQIKLALKLKPMAAPFETETFNLHYMELHALGTMNLSEDPSIRVYCPLHNWALSIRRNGADDTIPYTISESGDYLVIYRAAIELWDLTNSSLSGSANASAATNPFSILAADLKCLSLSISWDGSQIAMSGENTPFKLYTLNRQTSMLEESTKAKSTDLVKFEGLGSFHKGIGNQSQDQDDELFVAVNQNTVSIYRVYGTWEFLRTIHHTSPMTSEIFWSEWSTSRSISDRIQARHFISRNIDPDDSVTGYMTHSVFIWNLDSGRLVRAIKISNISFNDVEFLSSDASLLIVRVDGVITSFCLRSGARLTAASQELGNAVPIRGGSSLIHTSDGFIRNSIGFTSIFSSSRLPESTRVLSVSKEGESFKAYFEDHFSIYQQTWRSAPCNKECLANLNPARKNIWSFVDFGSSLEFSVKDNKKISGRSLYLVITDLTQKDRTRSIVLDTLQYRSTTEVTFSPKDRSLIVKTDLWFWVYKMPRKLKEDLSLVSIQDLTSEHLTCVHGRSYFHSRLGYSSLLQLEMNQLATVSSAFVKHDWWCLFSKDLYLPKYINRHINQLKGCGVKNVTQGDCEVSMMKRLCLEWFIDDDETPLIEQVLVLPECQWVPQLKMEFNPAQYFLDMAKTQLQAKAVFHLLSDYCHQKAKSEQNLLFLSPIAACLPTLLDPGLPHSKIAILALQKMAFFPAPLRSVIMERHAVIHPPEFRVKFWNPNSRPLFQCRNPILQLESAGSSEVVNDPTMDAFKEEMFVATFDMIWTDKREPDVLNETSYPAGVSPSILYWIKMAPSVVHYKLNPWLDVPVKCHEFSLEALDNPALSALILYKWSTLGFYFWLTRFTIQCLFYALVIVTAFLQVYAPSHESVTILSGIIGVMSLAFLLLELSQSLRDPARYLGAIVYNLVDIAAFILPLGGCINQFNLRYSANENSILDPRGPNSWLYSFSILIIALHLLFELRVNKTVCRFVSAIVRIFIRIRIFFIIFLVGLLAFTAALLHLLRGCVQEPCAELTTNFPGNFYLAFSTVFYFIVTAYSGQAGGKYDPISDDFTQRNWAFHTMMIIYLFFTVILMLNVLIALINSGYDESDTTWELAWLQNRLFYIESAENLSHFIPGLREKYDIFPQEIYYCLSEAKIQEYKTRWSKNDGLWSKNDELWSAEETKEEILKRKLESLKQEMESQRRKLNEELITQLLKKGGRMDNLERQLKRIEKMLRDQRVQIGTEMNESTTDDSESSNEQPRRRYKRH